MKRVISILTLALMFTVTITKAQNAMDFYGMDCNGTMHNMFSELDAGKAVILHFYMPNCGSCPPPAQEIQAMANNILGSHPNMITAYAFPYQNSTTCAYSSSWVSSNGLTLYSPMDSGATQVAHYGGFGMPTVVLLGGTDHRVMFSTLAYSTSDTTIMRDSILALFGVAPTVVNEVTDQIASFMLSPNPASGHLTVTAEIKGQSNVLIDIIDVTGKQVAVICNEKESKGMLHKDFNTGMLANGMYTVRLNTNGKILYKNLHIVH